MGYRRRPLLLVVLVALTAALGMTLAACGGSDSSSSSSSSGSSSSAKEESTETTTEDAAAEESGDTSAGVEEVIAEVTAPAEWNGPTEPSPAVKNKHIAFIEVLAALEGEQILQEGAEEASKALGWTSTFIDGKGTPQGFEAAISQALSENVDGIWMSGVAPEVVPNGLKKIKAAGIPVVLHGESEPSGSLEGLYIASVGYDGEKEGKAITAHIAKENPEAKIMIVEDKEFPIDTERIEYFEKFVTELCPKCEVVDRPQMQSTEIETQLGPKIGNELQANPTVNYIWVPFDSAVPPIVAAVKQAGLEDEIGLVSTGGQPQSLEFIRNGEVETGTVAASEQWQAWEAYDVFNRTFNEQKIPKSAVKSDALRLIEKSNLPPPGQLYDGREAEFEKHYEELWGLK